MILDIQYVTRGPEQIQNVRRTNVYVPLGELVITFEKRENLSPLYIPLEEIVSIQVTND